MPQGNETNVGRQPIWDTMQLTVAAARTTYHFFSIPQGGLLAAGVVKNLDHTFLHQVSMLDANVEFRAQAISMHVRPLAAGGAAPTEADMQVLQQGSIELIFNGQPFRRWPTALIPSGPAGLMYNTVAVAATHIQRGISANSNIFEFGEDYVIRKGENFNVDLNVTNIGAITDVVIVLWGVLQRPTI